jgi:hypothetical protein
VYQTLWVGGSLKVGQSGSAGSPLVVAPLISGYRPNWEALVGWDDLGIGAGIVGGRHGAR